MTQSVDLTKGNVKGRLWAFAFPFLVCNIFQSLYQAADMMIVGRTTGPLGISAIQTGGQIITLITNIALGLGVGSTILIARYKGEKNREFQRQTVSTELCICVISALLFTILSFVLCKPILRLLKAEGEVYNLSKTYLMICAVGLLPVFGFNSLSNILRGMGNSQIPMYMVVISGIENIILDFVLVVFLKKGVGGAAVATVVSQISALLFTAFYVAKKEKDLFNFKSQKLKIYKDRLGKILKTGLPTAFQYLITGSSYMILTGMVNKSNGALGSALLGIGIRLITLGVLPCTAISSAVSTAVAQNIGNKNEKRAESFVKAGIMLTVVFSVTVFALVNIFPGEILNLFVSGKGETVNQCLKYGVKYIRLCSMDLIIAGLFFGFNAAAIGSGHTVVSLINSSLMAVFIRVPLAYLLSKEWAFGIFGTAWAMGLSPFIPMLIGGVYFLSGRWKKNKNF